MSLKNIGHTVLTKASGEEKIISSKMHAFIAAHPLMAMLIALAVGALVGHLV